MVAYGGGMALMFALVGCGVAADIAGEPVAEGPQQRLRYPRIKEQEGFGPVEIPEERKWAAERALRG